MCKYKVSILNQIRKRPFKGNLIFLAEKQRTRAYFNVGYVFKLEFLEFQARSSHRLCTIRYIKKTHHQMYHLMHIC